MRYYWDVAIDDCIVRMSNSSYVYGYEYLGASPRLVITPLTVSHMIPYMCLSACVSEDMTHEMNMYMYPNEAHQWQRYAYITHILICLHLWYFLQHVLILANSDMLHANETSWLINFTVDTCYTLWAVQVYHSLYMYYHSRFFVFNFNGAQTPPFTL